MKTTTPQARTRLEELAHDHTCAHRVAAALDPDAMRDTVTPQDILTTLRIDPSLAVVTLTEPQEVLTYAPTEDGTAEYLVVAGDDDDQDFVTVGRRRANDLLRSGDVALGVTDDTERVDAATTPRVGGGA